MAKKPVNLKEGDKAPDFSAVATGGAEMALSDLKGTNIVTGWYC